MKLKGRKVSIVRSDYQKVRLAAVKEVLEDGKSVKEVSLKYDCCRQTLFLWIKRYKADPKNASFNLKDSYKRGHCHYKSLPWNIEKLVLDWVVKEPGLSLRGLQSKVVGRGYQISTHAVHNILVKNNLQRVELRKEFREQCLGNTFFATSISPINRVRAVEEHLLEGKKIAQVCREWKVSRPTFYQWLLRYKESKENERVQSMFTSVVEALVRRYKRGAEHHRAISSEAREAILDAVRTNPSFSVHKIHSYLTKLSSEHIGHHAIQNLLSREGLSTLFNRLRFVGSVVPQRNVVVAPLYRPVMPAYRLGMVFGLIRSLPSLIMTDPATGFTRLSFMLAPLLFVGFWIKMVIGATSHTNSPIGLVFASVALFFGFFFFVYSMKYYSGIVMVLKVAQSGYGARA